MDSDPDTVGTETLCLLADPNPEKSFRNLIWIQIRNEMTKFLTDTVFFFFKKLTNELLFILRTTEDLKT